jgi:hypothetical protein
MTNLLYYFSYGSNLHPVRLTERIFSATLIGTVKLKKYRLEFHKKRKDKSGKCNLMKSSLEND